MKAGIITIGDEILIGQIIDTNSKWLSTRLNNIGIAVSRILTVGDDREEIMMALKEMSGKTDIIITTGGLGPTSDDITKDTLCDYFNATLIRNEQVLADVEKVFAKSGRPPSDANKKQADVPSNAIPLRNPIGTAPGLWIEDKGKLYISLPGVPYEMKAIITGEVEARLKEKYKLPVIYHKTVLTQGIGESNLAEKIRDWEGSLAYLQIRLAYLPSPGMVKLRLSITGENGDDLKSIVEGKMEELQELAGKYIFGFDDDTLEEIVGALLKKNNKTLSTAESCTGGYIAHLITSVPGSSDYYMGSVISYSNQVKKNWLDVNPDTMEEEGVVSQAVVEQMATGVRNKMKTDYSIAVSGIAGPSGGTPDKPVGTVWIAINALGKLSSRKFIFGNDRGRNIQITALTVLNMLRKELVNINKIS